MPYVTSIPFPELKTSLINQFKSTNCLRNLNLKAVRESDSIYQMNYAFEDIAYDVIEKSYKTFSDNLVICKKLSKSTLPLENLLCGFLSHMAEVCTSLGTILAHEDTNPEVLKIKKELIENYGVENLYLDNKITIAQNTLEAARLLKKSNIPLPKNIICSRFFHSSIAFPGQNTIIIDSKNDDGNVTSSTYHPSHTIIHESVHCIQPPTIFFMMKKIPAKFKEVVNNLSFYAQGNLTTEVHAELLTKKIIEGLNSQEEELLQYLGGTWFA